MFSKDTQFQALSVYNVGHLITNHVSHVCDLTGKYDPYLLFSMCVANSSFFHTKQPSSSKTINLTLWWKRTENILAYWPGRNNYRSWITTYLACITFPFLHPSEWSLSELTNFYCITLWLCSKFQTANKIIIYIYFFKNQNING